MATKKAAKKAVKKTAVKKAPVKKAAIKKAPAKKAVTKKVAATKKAAVKKTPAKKAPAKKASKKAAPLTTVIAKVDIGWGNNLYLRGEGGGLDWDKGILMDCVDGDWTWSTASAKSGLVFKFVINDETWSAGEDFTVAAGGTSVSSPSF